MNPQLQRLRDAQVELRETGTVATAAAGGSRRQITIIAAGWGSSGYYSRDLLESDGPAAFPEGLHMYLDHPSRSEEADRPERSVKDLAARIASTPRMVDGELVAEAEIFAHWAPVIDALADDIGLSIRAHGTSEAGEAEGRQGPIITAITEGISVDFVTRAGAGGKIGELIESARDSLTLEEAADLYDTLLERDIPTAERVRLAKKGQAMPVRDGDGNIVDGRFPMANCGDVKNAAQAIGRARGDVAAMKAMIKRVASKLSCPVPFQSASAESMRETLQSTVAEQLTAAAQERWANAATFVYMDDYDPDQGWAVFCISPQGGERSYVQVAYEATADGVTLATDTQEVRRTTAYEPVTSAATESEKEEAEMAETERLAQLEETVRQHTTKIGELETERDREKDRADRAEEALLARDARDIVREAIAAVEGLSEKAQKRAEDASLPPREAIPTKDDGSIDKDKLVETAKAKAEEERTYLEEATGKGRVRGMGPSGGEPPDEETTKKLTEAFQRLGNSEKAAEIAAAGR